MQGCIALLQNTITFFRMNCPLNKETDEPKAINITHMQRFFYFFAFLFYEQLIASKTVMILFGGPIICIFLNVDCLKSRTLEFHVFAKCPELIYVYQNVLHLSKIV